MVSLWNKSLDIISVAIILFLTSLKAVADRNDICLLVVHHLRKQEDKDPFKQLSGTNGLKRCR